VLQVFGVAFRRNARWSTNQPVPELGDETTPLDKVCGCLLVCLKCVFVMAGWIEGQVHAAFSGARLQTPLQTP
jgi:hypothetical protein